MEQQIGDFRILRTLGQGGMGAVYEGVRIETSDHEMAERVAIKVLLAHHDSDDELRQRFASEINTLKHLRHPNIVRLHGFGTDEGHPYYVMELVDGLSLSAELKCQRRFEWIEVAKIGLDLCRALKYAGDRGIIHRDIKPANIMLDHAAGVIKLSDFGIAHFFGADQASDLYSIIGTLEYMAPEQALGRPVGPKADLYAVGAVLYTLLVRRPPHIGKTLTDIRHKHQNEQIISISSLRRDVPPDITFLIYELLNVDPQQRPIGAQMVVRRIQATLRALVGDPDKILLTPTDTSRGITPVAEVASRGASADQVTQDAQANVASVAPKSDGIFALSAERSESDRSGAERSGVDKPRAVSRSDSTSHFVVVREEELGHYETPTPRVIRPMFVFKTVSLIVCLAAIAALMVYLLQPLPPEELLNRIRATISDAADDSEGDGDRLTALRLAEHDINTFLRCFPEHASCAMLEGYLDELRSAERQRRLETRLLRLNPKQLLPIEHAYLEAWSIRQSDPEQAAERLRAILLLYRRDTSDGEISATTPRATRAKFSLSRQDQVLDRANAQIQAWETSQQETRATTLRFLRQRLDEAATLETTNPETAAAIRKAIVDLYGTKPWAAAVISGE